MKKVLFLGLIFCFLLTIPAAEKVTRLGQHPFYRDKDIQPGDLKVIAVEKAGDVKMGFEEAGNGDLVFAFLEQIQKADIQMTELKPGDTLEWMFFKEGRKVKVKKDVIYEGKKPVPSYTFVIFREGKTYEFIVPKICGNISLKNTNEVPAPVCSLVVSPEQVEIGQPVKIDVCGSKDALKSTVIIKDAAGTEIKTLELNPENCTAEFTFDKVGEYTISDIAEGQYAVKSNPCEAVVKVLEPAPVVAPIVPVAKANPLHFLISGGPGLLKGTYTGMIWARAGISFNIAVDKLDFILSLGGGVPVKGEPWKSFFMGNALLNVHTGPAYLAGGLGYSTKEREGRKGGIDLVGELGINLFRSNDSVGSILGEVRAPVITSDRPFEDHHKLLFGFRFIF
jgi:uncharacterized OB-fold protein